MADYFKPEEALAPEQREQQLMAALPEQLSYAKANCRYYAELLTDIEVSSIDSREALATLPITHKADLIALQAKLDRKSVV